MRRETVFVQIHHVDVSWSKKSIAPGCPVFFLMSLEISDGVEKGKNQVIIMILRSAYAKRFMYSIWHVQKKTRVHFAIRKT